MDSVKNNEMPQEQPADEAPLSPPFYKRLIDLFFSPGKLGDDLAANPVWAAALILTTALIVTSIALIPPEIFVEMQRQAILQSGREVPVMPDSVMEVMRWVTPIAAGLSVFVFTFIFAGLYALIFAFIMGDEGKYRQYLAVTAHAMIIPAFAGLMITPLRISTENPNLTLNFASFMFFLSDGYLLNFFKAMDLTSIWSGLVIAMGAHSIDNRRSFASAAMVPIGLTVVIGLIAARLMP